MDRPKALKKSWDGNAGNWTQAVREGLIPSRRAGTDEAIVADEEESALLAVSHLSPALLFERTSSAANGRIVEFVRTLHRGDRYKFEVESARHSVPAGQG